MNESVVVGLGELLFDCFADSRRPGGAPANVAFHSQQLGRRGVVCSRVGVDALGDELCAYLDSQGLDVTAVQRDPMHATGTVTVNASLADQPSYVIHTDVAWDFLEFTSSVHDLVQKAEAVCFGTLAQRSPTTRETIRRCLRATREKCLVVYDVNLRQNWYQPEWIEPSLIASDVVKLNIDEARILNDLLGVGRVGELDFCRALIERFQVQLVCLTRGGDGCTLISPSETVEAPAEPAHVVDAVGAGDAFTAALIDATLRHRSLASTARFANRIGGLVVGQSGAMPSLSDEFAQAKSDLLSE